MKEICHSLSDGVDEKDMKDVVKSSSQIFLLPDMRLCVYMRVNSMLSQNTLR